MKNTYLHLNILCGLASALAFSSCGVQIRSLNPATALQRLALAVEITPQTFLVRGGDALTMTYNVPAFTSPVQAIALQKSLDSGVTFSTIAHLDPAATQTSWQSPVSNIADVRFRLLVTTADGKTYTAETAKVEVDATPPAVPAITLATASSTNNPVARVTVTSCTDRAKIMITQTPAAPSYGAVGWTTCSTTASAFPSTLLSDGTTTLYVWAQDLAGNISTTSASTSVTLDATLPVLTLLNLTGGQTIPASVPIAILWSATDAHFGATPISLEVSSDSGANWSSLSASEANDGTYTWTPPNVSSATYRVRVSATDTFGNVKTALSTTDFSISNTTPALSFVSTTPTSPSNASTTPTIIGATGASTTTVSLFSDSGCTVSLASGTRATFIGAGIAITATANASTTVYGKATDGALFSGCTYLTTYVHDTVVPADLTYLSLSPASPSSSLSPKISGLAASDVAIANFYSNAGCTTSIGSGTRSDFVSPGPGISLSVSANLTTSIYGKATDAAGNVSATCVLLTTNIHDNVNPNPATGLTHAATFASLTDSPAISWTLATDNVGGSGVRRYEISVGISAGDTRILSWSTVSGGAAPTLPMTLTGLNLTDATAYYVNLRTVDLAGNLSTVVSSTGWTAQVSTMPQIAPAVLTLEINTPYTFTTTGGSVPYTYSIVSGSGTVNANTGVYTAPATPGGPYTIRVTDAGGLTSDSVVTIVPDQTLPVISSFTLNGGSANASSTSLPVAITAVDPGASSTGIAGYRFGLTSDLSAATWVLTPPTFYNFPYVSGNQSLYAQVKDGAGNLSAVAVATLSIFVGSPPMITLLKPDGSVLYSSAGASVHIAWKIVFTYPLDPAGINVAYTTDNGTTYTAWPGGAALSPDANAGCTIDAGATGCVNLSLPVALANTPFRIRVKINDTTMNSAYILSPSLNIAGLTLFAGANSSALGAAAKATQLENAYWFTRDPKSGDYFIAAPKSILRLNSSTNTLTRFAGDPSTNAFAGDGGPVANTRFETPGNNEMGNFISSDKNGNVYWASDYLSGLWKYDASTGNASVIVGPRGLVGNRSIADGTNGRDFDSDIDGVRVTPDGTVYFDTYHKSATLTEYRRVYRLEANGTTTRLAGCMTDDCTGATDGAVAKSIGVWSWSVRPGATPAQDEIYFISNYSTGTQGIYLLNSDGTVTLKRAEASQKFFSDYLPILGRFVLWDYPGNFSKTSGRSWNPASPATAYSTVIQTSRIDSLMSGVMEDPAGNILFATRGGHVINIKNPSAAYSTFAGVIPDAGDGGPATLAQIRAPDRLTFDSSGTAYFWEAENVLFRTVSSSGVASRLSYYNAALTAHPDYYVSTGVGIPLFTFYAINASSNAYGGGTGSMGGAGLDSVGACTWFCGPNTNPYNLTASTSAAATTLYRADATLTSNNVKFAYDGTDLYAWVLGDDQVPYATSYYSSIKKIDSGGSMTTVAGNPGIANTSAVNTSTPLLGNIIGSANDLDSFKVVNGTIFFSSLNGGGSWVNDPRLYTGVAGGNWVQQGSKVIHDFAVSGTDRSMYFIVGTQLWRKNFLANGTGTETMIADFTGILTAPKVSTMDPANANTLMIIDQNSIYRYRDAVEIH